MMNISAPARPSVWPALRKGFSRQCPHCGRGALFGGYLKLVDRCPACDEPLGHIRADDLPPYLTIVLVGHIVVPLLWTIEETYAPPVLPSVLLWCGLTSLLTWRLLPRVKGAAVGLMWALGLSGRERQ